MANNLRQQIQELLDQKLLTQSELAKATGFSDGLISSWKAGKYMGRNDDVDKLIAEFLAKRANVQREVSTLKLDFDFVPTNNYLLAKEGIDTAEARGEFRLMIGVSGVGKTMALDRIHKDKRTSILIRAYRGITTKGFMTKMCKELGLEPKYSFGAMFENIIPELNGTRRQIMVDEAEHLPIDALDALRRINDFTGCSVILCGLPLLFNMLRSSTRYTYIYNRTALNICLEPLSTRDIAPMVATMVDTPVEAEFWFEACQGIGRHLKTIVQESLRLAAIAKNPIDVRSEPERFKKTITGVAALLGRNPQK